MKEADRAALKQLITERIARLGADIAALEALTQPVEPDRAIGRLTRMDSMVSQGVNEIALLSARQTKASLEVALARADELEFGICRECDKPIPVERLLAVPETDRCVGCAALTTSSHTME